MIAARQIFLGRGGAKVPTAIDYVQTGLIAMWDGVENAGWGVHDANATTWVDLVGNANLILLGNCTFNDSYCTIMGNNNAAYAQYSSPISVASGYGWTFHFVWRPLVATSYVCRPYSCRGGQNGIDGYERYQQNGTSNGLFSGDGTGLTERHGLFTTTLNTIISEHYVISSNGDLTIYANGDLVATSTCKVATSLPNVGLGNSTSQYGNRGVDEDVFDLGIYNRVLTAAEVSANSAVDKARFNLP